MKQLWKWSGLAAMCVATVSGIALAGFYVASDRIIFRQYDLPPSSMRASAGPAAVARGKQLAFGYGCADCHGHALLGAFIPDFGMSSRNLTRLASSFSDTDFERAVRHGLRPDGTSVAEFMPSDSFRYMPDRDLADILAYVRSLPPAGTDIPFPSYGLKARIGFLRGDAHTDQYWFALQKAALDLGPHYARGRVVAMTACGECHMTPLSGQPENTPPPRPPDLSLVASYSRADFLTLMHTGKAAGNRELPMMSAAARVRFSHFSGDDLNALYDYLSARGRKLTGG